MSEPAVLYEAKDFIATITLNRPENRNSMTEDVFEGPAALLYAFARVPRAFAAPRTMTVLLTLAQASASGQHLAATPRELAEWVERAARGELGYQDVRSALAERLLPFGG